MYKKTVKEILEVNKASRDNDQLLYGITLKRLGFPVEKKSSLALIASVYQKRLPSLDTITRLRRMVQMNNPHLRGEEWDLRHGKKVEKALIDLGYVNA